MSRYPSHKGHVLLPLDGGWYVPDYMEPGEAPVSVAEAKRLIESRESHGEPRRDVREVTWDTSIVQTAMDRTGVNVGQAAAILELERGDRVRVTMRRLERCGSLRWST